MKILGFSNKWTLWLTMALLLGVAVFLSACSASEPVATPCPETECPECPEAKCPEYPEAKCPECPKCPEVECPEAECPEAVCPETECPEPPAPATATDIIAAKCAGCHMALPAEHTGIQDSDQCGLCHVPYGHTTDFEHNATTEGCPTCHSSPEVTHTYLRDEEDQAALAADAEARCIACHRDGGMQPYGRGVPALETEADILAAVEYGTLRAWIQPGGFMAKYLTAEEVDTITDWIDEISADRSISYNPYLDAVKIESDFDLNGRGDNAAWDAAEEQAVSVVPTIFTAADEVKLKALYSDEYLYIRVEYKDSTASLTRGGWILDDGAWRHPAADTQYEKQSEDRVSIIWNISTPNFRDGYGCAIKCHGNVPGSSEYTDLDMSTMDIWHSKAARGLGLYSVTDSGDLTIDTATEAFEATSGTINFSGVLDDKRLVWYMDLKDGYDLEDSGRRGDKGRGAYSHNRNGDKSAPLFSEIAPDSWVDAMVLTQAEIDAGETIVADPSDAAYDADAVAAAWDNYVALGRHRS